LIQPLLEKIINYYLTQLSIFFPLKTNYNFTSIIYIYKRDMHIAGNAHP